MCLNLNNKTDDPSLKWDEFAVSCCKRDVGVSKFCTFWVCTDFAHVCLVFACDVVEPVRYVHRDLEACDVARGA